MIKVIIVSLFNQISSIGINASNSDTLNRKIKTINKTALLGVVVQNFHIIFNLIVGVYDLSIMNFLFSGLFYSIWILNHYRIYRIPAMFLTVVLPASLLPFNYLFGNMGSENLFFSLFILGYYIYDNVKYRVFISLFITILFFISKVIIHEHIGLFLYQEYVSSYYFANMFFSMLSLALVTDIYTKDHQYHVKQVLSINKSLSERNAFINNLMKELNHRVKNNLQLVSSLFRLQANKSNDVALKQELHDARDRVIAIAMVHRKLYTSNTDIEVSIYDYIIDMCNYLLQSVGKNNNEIIKYDIDEIHLEIEDAVHVGLILNELVTNAVKYGMDNKNQQISISLLLQEQNIIQLTVSDSGNGFPYDFLSKKRESFGYFLIDAIVEQYDGKLECFNNNGANIEILFNVNTISPS